MAEEAKNRLGALRAEYKAIVGKNPSPRLDAEALAAKIEELKANPPSADAPAAAAADKAKKPKPPKAPKPPKPPKEPRPPKGDDEGGLPPLGTALLSHPEKNASASYNGVELAPDRQGLFLVPLAAVEDLAAHGFRLEKAGK